MISNIPRLHFEMLGANRRRSAKRSVRRRAVKRTVVALLACTVLAILVLWKLNVQIGSYTADEIYQRALIGLGRLASLGWFFGDA